MKKILIALSLLFATACASSPIDFNECNARAVSYNQGSAFTLLNLVTFNEYSQWSSSGRPFERVFSGDSIVLLWGMLPADEGGYVWYNGANSATTVDTGIGGNRVCDLVKRQNEHIDKFHSQKIFLHVGGNDLIGGVPPIIINHHLDILFKSVRKHNPGARIVYGAIPPTQIEHANKLKVEVNRNAYHSLTKIGNACMVNINDHLAVDGIEGNPSKPELKGDGIHFDRSVYKVYRERVEQAFFGLPGPTVMCK